MHIGDIVVSMIDIAFLGGNLVHHVVFNLDIDHFFVGQHLTACSFYYLFQQFGHLLATPYKLVGAAYVQHPKEGAHEGGCGTRLATHQRV